MSRHWSRKSLSNSFSESVTARVYGTFVLLERGNLNVEDSLEIAGQKKAPDYVFRVGRDRKRNTSSRPRCRA